MVNTPPHGYLSTFKNDLSAMNTKLFDNIDWVGAVDWNIRDFHSYNVDEGTSYNAYLIRDEKIVLVDTVKPAFADELLKNVAALVELSRVDYVVCNHAELDHAGSLPQVMQAMPQATLLCDKKCAVALGEHFDTTGWKIQIVATGESLSIGKRTLQFLETPMVHWPESMFTYIPEDKLLFSMDAFGQHYATSERFDDEADLPSIMREAKTYYANIVMPYGKPVVACLEQAAKMDIRMIAPSHGLIWRSHIGTIVEAYQNWANYRVRPRVVVIYDTMWESTGAMAQAIFGGGYTARRQHRIDPYPQVKPDPDSRRGDRRGSRGVWLGHPQSRHDADGRSDAQLSARVASLEQGGVRFRFLWLGTRRHGSRQRRSPRFGVGSDSRTDSFTLSAHPRDP